MFLSKFVKYHMEMSIEDSICTKILLLLAFIFTFFSWKQLYPSKTTRDFTNNFKKQKGFIIHAGKMKTENRSNTKRAPRDHSWVLKANGLFHWQIFFFATSFECLLVVSNLSFDSYQKISPGLINWNDRQRIHNTWSREAWSF